MPPVSQFPPARVFLKTSATRPSSISTASIRSPLSSSPPTPRFTSTTSPSVSQFAAPKSQSVTSDPSSRR
ncbi:hypothetical protein OPT61_g1410 [Boeremia exigua]|uniref:Uncharacterized protein n=1 Tax=Boeremia exigua TaxID=749465 RepID=A0ACC2IQB5_9PLEO|nr:hypothetical protein OPT61_g1410 [Boeremia exigua]